MIGIAEHASRPGTGDGGRDASRGSSRATSSFRRISFGRLAVLCAAALGIAALLTVDHWGWLLSSSKPATSGVFAASIPLEDVDAEFERLYRISPDNGSFARYEVEERLLGKARSTVGSTTVMAGDIVLNMSDLLSSRVGEIVVNVETLTSDSALRDKRIRHDFLESGHWPFVRFAPRSFTLKPDRPQAASSGVKSDAASAEAADAPAYGYSDGVSYTVAITGDLTVKQTTRTETFTGEVVADEERLSASVSATVLSSDYNTGPVHIARLAHTADEVVLTFDLLADRVSLSEQATAGSASPAPWDASDSDPADPAEVGIPSGGDLRRPLTPPQIAAGAFTETVQPVLEFNCVSCHTSGGPGWNTFALDTAADAAEVAADIAAITGSGFMPPWLPSDLSPDFRHERSLSRSEKAAIAAWADAGGGLDVPPGTPLVPRGEATVSLPEDQRVVPRDGPYTGYSHPDGWPMQKDDYRCQVYEVSDPEGDGTWIKGMHFHPDQTSVVHHALVYSVSGAGKAEVAARIEAQDQLEVAEGLADEPGWTCFGIFAFNLPDVRLVQGWTPGQLPVSYPSGYGLYIPPGGVIVTQIHYHYDHETLPDASWIILDTLDAPAPTASGTDGTAAVEGRTAAGLKSVSGESYLTPAEIPCTPQEAALAAKLAASADGHANLCDRSVALDQLAQWYGESARYIPDLLLTQCAGTVDDYDDLDGSVAYSACELPSKNSGAIHAVLGHMHEFGTAYRMTLHPDTPEEKILLDIPSWDFEWQLSYEPLQYIRIERGDVVRFECWWDRSLQHMEEPRYVVWNQGTGDEMCFSFIETLPD